MSMASSLTWFRLNGCAIHRLLDILRAIFSANVNNQRGISMKSVLESPPISAAESAAKRLRTTMAAVRVSLSWLGVRKTLTPEQRSQAAESFGAEGEFLS